MYSSTRVAIRAGGAGPGDVWMRAAALLLVFGFVVKSWVASKVVIPRARVAHRHSHTRRLCPGCRGRRGRGGCEQPDLVFFSHWHCDLQCRGGAPVTAQQVLATMDSPALNNELAGSALRSKASKRRWSGRRSRPTGRSWKASRPLISHGRRFARHSAARANEERGSNRE